MQSTKCHNLNERIASMLTAPQSIVWFGATVIELLTLYIVLRCGQVRRFWALYLLFGAESCVSLLRLVFIQRHGLASREYAYLYYYSDAILVVTMFLVVVSLFAYANNLKTWHGLPVRLTIGGIAATAIFSYAVVEGTSSKLVTHFVVELSHNLFFAILMLAGCGWIAAMTRKLRASAEVKLIWVFVIYATMLTGAYAARNLNAGPGTYWEAMPQFAGLWLAAGCALAILFDAPPTDAMESR